MRRSSTSSVKAARRTASAAGSDRQTLNSSFPPTPNERGRPFAVDAISSRSGSLSSSVRRTPTPHKALKDRTSPKIPSVEISPKADKVASPKDLGSRPSASGDPGCPLLKVSAPTPESSDVKTGDGTAKQDINVIEEEFQDALEDPVPQGRGEPTSRLLRQTSTQSDQPPQPTRRQSLVPAFQSGLINTLLEDRPDTSARSAPLDYFSSRIVDASMVRKVWVKRPGASATLVTVGEEDLVDDVREVILRKYGNSLGRSFDAPDVSLRITLRQPANSRQNSQERILSPEEPIGRTLDTHYPHGQTVDEALVVEVPTRRTPRASPRYGYHMPQYSGEELRPGEAGDYFPPMHNPSPNVMPHSVSGSSIHPSSVHSMSVLTTGQLPPLPSPGAARSHKHHRDRPKYGRQHTSSPTILSSAQNQAMMGTYALRSSHSVRSSRSSIDDFAYSSPDPKQNLSNGPIVPSAPPLPTPPGPEPKPSSAAASGILQPPPPRVSSPRPNASSSIKPPKSSKKQKSLAILPSNQSPHTSAKPASAGLLDGSIPPINVLVVEDNVINMRLLEAFMKRLKVRWKGAKDGREAVAMWKTGGFHLVLMDIQLPIMSGLEATKEIRRLENLHNIGAFSGPTPTEEPPNEDQQIGKGKETVGNEGKLNGHMKAEVPGDDIPPEEWNLNKTPVIIVALTASSLQSDRHEALAAGCNDFLTKVRIRFPPNPLILSLQTGFKSLWNDPLHFPEHFLLRHASRAFRAFLNPQ